MENLARFVSFSFYFRLTYAHHVHTGNHTWNCFALCTSHINGYVQTNSYVNEAKRKEENLTKVLEIQNTVSGCEVCTLFFPCSSSSLLTHTLSFSFFSPLFSSLILSLPPLLESSLSNTPFPSRS